MDSTLDDEKPTVFIVDDDKSILEALKDLFQSVGLRVELFGSSQAFMSSGGARKFGCLVLDVRLPGQSGLEFQTALIKDGVHIPIVFISGHADVSISVRAMKAGAADFFTKPVRSHDLLEAVQAAIEQDRVRRAVVRNLKVMREQFDRLTVREREIMSMVVDGHQNKRIAADLGISEATVKLHRGHVMQKMKVQSVAELVRNVETLQSAGFEGAPASALK